MESINHLVAELDKPTNCYVKQDELHLVYNSDKYNAIVNFVNGVDGIGDEVCIGEIEQEANKYSLTFKIGQYNPFIINNLRLQNFDLSQLRNLGTKPIKLVFDVSRDSVNDEIVMETKINLNVLIDQIGNGGFTDEGGK